MVRGSRGSGITETNLLPLKLAVGLLLTVVMLAGCVRSDAIDGVPSVGAPSTFVGTLPCASCPGIDYHLNLLDDGLYFLRTTYQDREDGVFDDIGRFFFSSDAQALALHGDHDQPLFFEIVTVDKLQLLDRSARRIDSELNYQLTRAPHFEPIEPQSVFEGMYRYFADTGYFRECTTGKRLMVAAEADNRALEEAYLAAIDNPSADALVRLEGRIRQQPSAEGVGAVWALLPKRFIELQPDQICSDPVKRAELKNTQWRALPPLRFQPHLLLRDDGSLVGFDGCNRIIGRYELRGFSIRFLGMATTKMSCFEGMEQAARFMEALESVRHYKIIGSRLEMLDQSGNLKLSFEGIEVE